MSLKRALPLAMLTACASFDEVVLPTEVDDRAALLDLGEVFLALPLNETGELITPIVRDVGEMPVATIHLYQRRLEDLGIVEGTIVAEERGPPLATPVRSVGFGDGGWTPLPRFSGRLPRFRRAADLCPVRSRVRAQRFDTHSDFVVAVGKASEWEERFVVVGLADDRMFVADRTRSMPITPPVVDSSVCDPCKVVAVFRGFGDEVYFGFENTRDPKYDGDVWRAAVAFDPPGWTTPTPALKPTIDYALKRIAGTERKVVSQLHVATYEPQADGVLIGRVERLPLDDEPEPVFQFVASSTNTVNDRVLLAAHDDRVAALWPFTNELRDTAVGLVETVEIPYVSAVGHVVDFGMVVGDRTGQLHRISPRGVAQKLDVELDGAVVSVIETNDGFAAADDRGEIRFFTIEDQSVRACGPVIQTMGSSAVRIARVQQDIVTVVEDGAGAVLEWWGTP